MHPHSDFVHLHVHSEYSLLDGASRLEDLVLRAKELHMPAISLTDHGNLFGAIKFYQFAKKHGVKPILGCEFYLAPGNRFEKKSQGRFKPYFHFTVLARNEEGFRNLMRLSSAGYLEGYYYKPRVDMELLRKHHEGLLAMSGCLRGEIPSLILKDDLKAAETLAKELAHLYGDGHFYLELHDHGLSDQKKVNEGLRQIAQSSGLPLVAANDVHYTNREDSMAHDILLCIQTGALVEDEKRLKFSTDQFYLRDSDEMKQIFSDFPGAISNTIKIAEKCNVELDLKTYHLPRYRLPESVKDSAVYLHHLCTRGILQKYGQDRVDDANILERLEREFSVIKNMGFIDYFLITWDVIHYAKSRGIPVGPGRGSAAGSIVAYLLDITDIDPLKYDLLFERFLNENRITMPDIDIDFCYVRRNEVIKYVTEKYGENCVAQIITFGTMAAKAAVRDVGRVLNIPLADVDRIAKMIPLELNITIQAAIDRVPELKELYVSNEMFRHLLDYAINLEGMTRHASTHAAGIVISEKPLTENTPLIFGNDNAVTTQFDMSSIEKIGLLKMDFLGLKTLTVINETVRNVKRTRNLDIDIRKLPLDDAKTFALLNDGRTSGVFQLESSGMRSLMRRMGVDNFEEIIALIALYRPGPMNMLDEFIGRKQHKIPIVYDTPLEEPILRNTYGIMLYQEQVMQIVNLIGNFSLAEADIFRRAISKKIVEVMDDSRKKFIDGAVGNGVSEVVANKIFDDVLRFAGYGFNKSHSAAYAVISYQTAYLKANYTVEFMAAVLDSELNHTDKIVEYIDECKELGIRILPPCVNESYDKFTVVSEGIRFGLAAVKNIGMGAVESIISVRGKGGRFESIFDFAERNQLRLVNKRVIESLIKCGAFDDVYDHRAALFAGVDQVLDIAQSTQNERRHGQISFFEAFESQPAYQQQIHRLPQVASWKDGEKLAYEKEVLGFYVTGHPLSKYTSILRMYDFVPSSVIHDITIPQKEIKACGIVANLRVINTRRNDRMAFMTLEDLEGTSQVVIFPGVFEQVKNSLKEDTPLCVIGKIDIRNDDVQVIAQDIFPLGEICTKYTQEVVLNIPIDIRKETLESVKMFLNNHPGDCPVILNVKRGKQDRVCLRTARKYYIFPSERFMDGMVDVLGQDSVRYVAAQRNEQTF